jgi:hypothetical protein
MLLLQCFLSVYTGLYPDYKEGGAAGTNNTTQTTKRLELQVIIILSRLQRGWSCRY